MSIYFYTKPKSFYLQTGQQVSKYDVVRMINYDYNIQGKDNTFIIESITYIYTG